MKVAVTYLSRVDDGSDQLRFFIDAYRNRVAGCDHSLIILCKGYTNGVGVPYEQLEVPDTGFDLGSYRYAAQALNYEYFLFLNSHSRPMCDNWVSNLLSATKLNVGLAGCTGSYEACAVWPRVPAFPNPHIRTNAFLISKDLVLDMWPTTQFKTKDDAYQFESGTNGLTDKIIRAGLSPVVVDKYGKAYEVNDWESSRTFRSGNQEGLMVSDKHTRFYDESDPKTKADLTKFSWGHE